MMIQEVLKARLRYHKATFKLLRLRIFYYLNRLPINFNQINQLLQQLEGQIDMINYYKNQLANLAA